MEALQILKEPFPVKELVLIDFGSVDGRKDGALEDAFVLTTSIQLFLQDRHSIVIGPIGSGKSALFELLKNNSKVLKTYQNRLIIPIEEAISFQLLRNFIAEEFVNHDKKLIYRLIWKFQIINRICEELKKLEAFPNDKNEKEVNDFLGQIKSKEFDETILGKIKGLIKNATFTIKTKVSKSPISVESELKTNVSKLNEKYEINLDRVFNCVMKIIETRKLMSPLVIIDRIDTFVAGEDYDTQRDFIEALIEVDDDIDVSYPMIGRKIFLRSDLFSRLNYESLGYDKVNDNTLRIEWSNFELIHFIANRILTALKARKLLSEPEILLSTDLSSYHLSGLNWLRISKLIPMKIKKKLFNFSSINQERDASLMERINKAIITKVFPRKLVHKDSNFEDKEIDIFQFLLTHFKDGHDKVMPRNLLVFLKQVLITTIAYYEENPDQDVHVCNLNGDWEWELFKKKCIYEAYCRAKQEYINNIAKVNNEWTRYFALFLGKRGNKKSIDFNWMKTILNIDDEKVIAFLAYLSHIGFMYISEPHPDPKRRKYRIPIIYMPTPNTITL